MDGDLIWAWMALAGTAFGFGFIGAAPIGAVNIICIRRTLHHGPLNGFLSGIGAAFGDGFFAALVAFGLSGLASLIHENRVFLELIGAAILISYAVFALLTTPPVQAIEAKGEQADDDTTGLISAVVSTFGLTVINPATLLFFTAVGASAMGLMPAGSPIYVGAAVFVAGVILGSTAWWAVIVGITYFAHQQIGDRAIVIINRVTGVLIGLFGIAVLINIFVPFLTG
jgi:threonine/homoserine/homoserine lactone efflux protein